MKVLFVCHSNVGRSQMAKAFYNHLTHSNDAEAAGTDVREPGQTLLERKETSLSHNFFVLDVMKEVGLDMSQAKRLQLEKDMLSKYDLIVSMASKNEAPEWLLSSPKYVYWDIKDPRGQNFAITAKVRDEIKTKVTELVTD